MVDYSKQVRETIKIIDAFAEKGKFSPDDIAFHIKRQTGFGDSFTKKYISQCLERRFFSQNKDGLISSVKGDKSVL